MHSFRFAFVTQYFTNYLNSYYGEIEGSLIALSSFDLCKFKINVYLGEVYGTYMMKYVDEKGAGKRSELAREGEGVYSTVSFSINRH
jgi:hypothetical protein